MKKFYYMTSSSNGVSEINANTHWQVYMSIKSWFTSNTTIVIWDDDNDCRIFPPL